jgi:hypothetical protein
MTHGAPRPQACEEISIGAVHRTQHWSGNNNNIYLSGYGTAEISEHRASEDLEGQ